MSHKGIIKNVLLTITVNSKCHLKSLVTKYMSIKMYKYKYSLLLAWKPNEVTLNLNTAMKRMNLGGYDPNLETPPHSQVKPQSSSNWSESESISSSMSEGVDNPDHVIWASRWHSGNESSCQCMRYKTHRSSPWVGKIPWRRKWQPTPVFLPGESHGQRSLVSYTPWWRKRVGHDWGHTLLLLPCNLLERAEG